MRATFPHRLAAYYRWVLLALAIVAIGAYLYVALARLRYPFELEWMEGQSLVQVDRLRAGDPLYVRPSLQFIPFIYPPLYYYLSALLSLVIGGGFLPLRLVSLFASLGCFSAIYWLVTRETGDRTAGIVAMGVFAATYRASGAWFDLGRVDTLLLLFLLLGLCFLRRATARAEALAGLCFALAFITKQTAWIAFIPMALYSLVAVRRRGVVFIGTAVVAAAASTALLDWVYHGWYNFYIFYLPSQHTSLTTPEWLLFFWRDDMLGILPVASFFALYGIVDLTAAWEWRNRAFYLCAAAGMLGLSWAGRLNQGGYDNVLLPASPSPRSSAGSDSTVSGRASVARAGRSPLSP